MQWHETDVSKGFHRDMVFIQMWYFIHVTHSEFMESDFLATFSWQLLNVSIKFTAAKLLGKALHS